MQFKKFKVSEIRKYIYFHVKMCKNMENIQSRAYMYYILIFEWNKFGFHFFSYVYKNNKYTAV